MNDTMSKILKELLCLGKKTKYERSKRRKVTVVVLCTWMKFEGSEED